MRQVGQPGQPRQAAFFPPGIVWAVVAVMVAGVSLPATAETIVRKDGRKIEGQIVNEDNDYVTVQTVYGTFRVSKDQIVSISGRRAVSQNEREGREALAAGKLDEALDKLRVARNETAKPDERKAIDDLIEEVNTRIQDREEKRFAAQLATADRLIQEKRFADAMSELDGLLKREIDNAKRIKPDSNPTSAPTAAMRMIVQRKGRLRMAEASYYVDQINYAEAAAAYQKAIELMPDNPEPQLKMARLIQRRGGKDTDAIKYFVKGIELALRSRSESGLLDEYYELGKAYLRAASAEKDPGKNLMEGIQCLLIVSRDGPTSYPFAANQLENGFVQLSKTAYDTNAMVKMLQSTLQINPGAQKARWILAEVYSRQRAYDKAISELLKIEADAKASGQPLPEELHYRLGLCYMALPTPDRGKALAAFENEIRQNKLNYMALIKAAELHTLNGTYDDALAYCDQAIALRKERPEAYLVAGDAHMRRSGTDDMISARRYLQMALNVKSDFQPARIKLAEIEILQQRKSDSPNYQPAIELLLLALQGLSSADKNSLTADDDHKARAEAILWVAEIENDKKNPREAANKVREALAEYPNFTRAYKVQGQIQVSLEAFDDAKKSYLKAIELDPQSNETYMLLGLLCQNYMKSYAEAIKYYREYLRLHGTEVGHVTSWIGECEKKTGGATAAATTTTTETATAIRP
jgi:tetratricopeptide (TPR) repeat protein